MRTSILAALLIAAAGQAPDNTSDHVAELIEQLGDEKAGPHAFHSLLEVGAEAVPQLIRAQPSGDADHREATNLLLLTIGCEAVPPAIAVLRDEDPATRESAALCLGYLATHARWGGFDPTKARDETAAPALSKTLNEKAVPALTGALDDGDLRVRAAALDALASIGPDAVAALPRLLQSLREERVEGTRELVFAVGQLGDEARPGVERLLESEDDVIRARASAALESIRIAGLVRQLQDKESLPDAAPALIQLGPAVVYPILRQLEREWVGLEGMGHGPNTFLVAGTILQNLGAPAVAPLVETLQDGNALLRILAAAQLGRLGMFAKASEPALREAQESGIVPAFVQGFELSEVAALKEALAETAVPALQIALRDDSTGVREFASIALGNFGEVAGAALPDLLTVLKDKDDLAGGSRATSAIARIGPEAVPGLVEALGHEDALVRRRALDALLGLGPGAADALPALVKALDDRDTCNREVAARALGALGARGATAVAALREKLNDPEPRVGAAAASAIAKITPESDETLSTLIAGLSAEAPVIRYEAAKALAELGPKAVKAVPHLLTLLHDEDGRVRAHAAEAVGRVGAAAAQALPALMGALEDEDSHVRMQAARAVGSLGPDAKEAVPLLIKLARHDPHQIRLSAIAALGAIGAEDDRVVPALIELLSATDGIASQVRARAAHSLGRIGKKAGDAIPSLIAALGDRSPPVRQAAATALGAIGPDAKDAVPALVGALSDDYESVRETARKALQKIDSSWEPP